MRLARTNAEAHLYMDMTPCGCGETRFARRSAVVTRGEDLCSQYKGPCAACGTIRTFVFAIPEQILVPRPGEVRFGGAEPSQLLDPGEWLAVADERARRRGRQDLAIAIAAVEEILKFVPVDADAVPEAAFTSERGRAVCGAETGRFQRARLESVLAAYRELLRKLDGGKP